MGTPIGEILVRRPLDWKELEDRTLAIDSYNTIYQFLSNIRSADGQLLLDSKGRVTSHLTGLLYRTANLVDRGIKPIFVFDGARHPLKSDTIAARKKIRTQAGEKLEIARKEGDISAIRRFAGQSSQITPQIVDSAKKLVQLLGFPMVQASGEGEAQMAHLISKGEAFAGVSQDYDALLFGCDRLVRNLAVSGRRKIPGKNAYVDVSPEFLQLSTVLSELKLSRQKLVWLSMLVGTDFNEKFPRIGAKTALKIVQANDSFEDIIKYTEFSPEFDYNTVERIFLEPDCTDKYSLEFGPIQTEAVRAFLVDEHSFSAERVDGVLEKMIAKRSQKGAQSRLADWS